MLPEGTDNGQGAAPPCAAPSPESALLKDLYHGERFIHGGDVYRFDGHLTTGFGIWCRTVIERTGDRAYLYGGLLVKTFSGAGDVASPQLACCGESCTEAGGGEGCRASSAPPPVSFAHARDVAEMWPHGEPVHENPARGILVGAIVSLPIWLAIIWYLI